MLSLIVGIVSSLIATALFISGSELLRRVALPWYADKIYRGARIDGRWEAFEFDGQPIEAPMQLDLMQRGDTVSGTYSHKNNSGTTDIYEISGRIRDGYFLATFTPQSNRHIDGGTMLMFISNKKDNFLMTGSTLYFGDAGKVDAAENFTFRWLES
ncbi:hypothetical protein [Luteimonas sp. A501]